MTSTTERDDCPPHGIERKPLVPTLVRHEDGSVYIELGYSLEYGPACRASFFGTPQTIIRDYLTPLMDAAMHAAEPVTDDVNEIVAAAEAEIDPEPRPVMCFDQRAADALTHDELEFLHRQIDGWYSDDWTPRLLATVEALRMVAP